MRPCCCRRIVPLAAVVLGGLMATPCFAQPLKAEQQRQLDAIEALRARARGQWLNPSYPGVVTLTPDDGKPKQLLKTGATGTWSESKANGAFVNRGRWSFENGGSGQLGFEKGGERVRTLLVGEQLMVLEPIDARGVPVGDGVVLFRSKYDFEGLDRRAIPPDEAQRQRVVGRWTHVNSDLVHDVTPDFGWTERRKKGGINARGSWRVQDDGSYVVTLDNQWRLRLWPTGNDKLAVLVFQPNGEMAGDGLLLSRE